MFIKLSHVYTAYIHVYFEESPGRKKKHVPVSSITVSSYLLNLSVDYKIFRISINDKYSKKDINSIID